MTRPHGACEQRLMQCGLAKPGCLPCWLGLLVESAEFAQEVLGLGERVRAVAFVNESLL